MSQTNYQILIKYLLSRKSQSSLYSSRVSKLFEEMGVNWQEKHWKKSLIFWFALINHKLTLDSKELLIILKNSKRTLLSNLSRVSYFRNS